MNCQVIVRPAPNTTEDVPVATRRFERERKFTMSEQRPLELLHQLVRIRLVGLLILHGNLHS